MARILTGMGDGSVTLASAVVSPWLVLLLVVGTLLGAVVLLYVRGVLRREQAKEGADQARAVGRFTERLRSPDFAAFAAHYGCPPGSALRALLADGELLTASNLEIPVPAQPEAAFVAWFYPMDAEALAEPAWPGSEGLHAIANDGAGNLLMIAPCEDDPAVVFFDHETSERAPLGVRLSELTALARRRR
jgi:hypothetical protein